MTMGEVFEGEDLGAGKGKFIGVLSRGTVEVEVYKEPSGYYTFSAVNEESVPYAVELAHLQAMSHRDFSMDKGETIDTAAEGRWRQVLRHLKDMERSE